MTETAHISEQDREIALLHIAGKSQRAIARKLGVHYNTVYRTLRKPAVQNFIEQHKDDLQERLAEATAQTLAERFDELAYEATDHLTGLMRDADSENVKLKATESVLDRSSISPKREIHTKAQIDHRIAVIAVSVITLDQLKQMHRAVVMDSDDEEPPLMIPEGAVGKRLYTNRKTGQIIGEEWVYEPEDLKATNM